MTRPKGFKKPNMDSNIPPPNFDNISKKNPLPDVPTSKQISNFGADSKKSNATIERTIPDFTPRYLNIPQLTTSVAGNIFEHGKIDYGHFRTKYNSSSLDSILKVAMPLESYSSNSSGSDSNDHSKLIHGNLNNLKAVTNAFQNVQHNQREPHCGAALPFKSIDDIIEAAMTKDSSSNTSRSLYHQHPAAAPRSIIQNEISTDASKSQIYPLDNTLNASSNKHRPSNDQRSIPSISGNFINNDIIPNATNSNSLHNILRTAMTLDSSLNNRLNNFHQNLPRQLSASPRLQYLDFLMDKSRQLDVQNLSVLNNPRESAFSSPFHELQHFNTVPNLPSINANIYLNSILNGVNSSPRISSSSHDFQQLLALSRESNEKNTSK